jgi:hypothetical protein
VVAWRLAKRCIEELPVTLAWGASELDPSAALVRALPGRAYSISLVLASADLRAAPSGDDDPTAATLGWCWRISERQEKKPGSAELMS